MVGGDTGHSSGSRPQDMCKWCNASLFLCIECLLSLCENRIILVRVLGSSHLHVRMVEIFCVVVS